LVESLEYTLLVRQQKRLVANYEALTLVPVIPSVSAKSSNIAAYPIPPSGHMLGVYARTDIERGVHKAPANEVVRGITSLQRMLNKSEQDILNPYPININDPRLPQQQPRHPRLWRPRHHQRSGLEVRQCAPALDLHRSLDRSRPAMGRIRANAELCGRGAAPIVNFHSGLAQRCLEGPKAEEAFFVKCDRTAR
jgi:hypothetical protein